MSLYISDGPIAHLRQ